MLLNGSRKIFYLALISFLLLVSASVSLSQSFDCYAIVVGKDASADGSVLFAHNEDDGGEQLVQLFRVPERTHASGATVQLKNGGTLPLPSKTCSYIWFHMPKMDFSDSYFNAHGVVIASDACSSREDKPEITDGGISYWLRRAMAERARTAREAVHIGARLVEKYGYASSGRTYIIADANEGWLFAVVKGKHWVAQRVPDDHVAVIPNYYTIGKVDLSDTTNFLACDDLIDYAIQRGWYNPDTDGEFNFAKVYSNPGNLKAAGNVHRMWRGVCLVSGKNFNIEDEFPFSIKPEKKLSKEDIMRVLRDHYEGAQLDKSEHYKLGSPYKLNRFTICAPSTQYGFIAQLRNWLPKEIGNVLWWAPRRPDSEPFLPIYLGTLKFPEGFSYESWEFSLKNHWNPPEEFYENRKGKAFWTFRALSDWIDEDYGNRIAIVQKQAKKFENSLFTNQMAFENKILAIYDKNKQKALEQLTEYSNDQLIKAWKQAESLISKEE